MKQTNTLRLTTTALLTAIAIAIPMVMPIRVLIEPASFTLASHVPIFFAMFLSPKIAVAVSLGSAFGFLLAGFPIVVTMRAMSHVVFALLGALYLSGKREEILSSPFKSQLFSFVIAMIHALAEVLIVSLFFFGLIDGPGYQDGFFYAVFLLVGVGTVIHSMVDFFLAQFIWQSLGKRMTQIAQRVY
ncbi:Substrate-specific component NiaX of predicted niacin ECF transporter [Alkalibacterium sp. AK22]|uniref:membrane protein n=1 Tax=Alkalibacterium sp. AK22 TaxID=1229520 RepID=UPI00044F9A0A|nr:membrane protein [Alkalibacterium sp. AK22]EXJ22474.1 Substrate-specific component NiaX of predicted niacin ECF transporter [Alkalibacterium sp. AK22]